MVCSPFPVLLLLRLLHLLFFPATFLFSCFFSTLLTSKADFFLTLFLHLNLVLNKHFHIFFPPLYLHNWIPSKSLFKYGYLLETNYLKFGASESSVCRGTKVFNLKPHKCTVVHKLHKADSVMTSFYNWFSKYVWVVNHV